ncbi:Dynein heavy chain, cytoplasmic [Astathelohania contejeani]|uniref:Dynein heavy chain, cytoplasmic n=1 Tax=Astathelohania contejeani TaxID=164912 RepID=A0ABQ7I0U9_9MICR|nr:Dynein heavy chain, cytoplasmic [Thelohania contejeani]
MHNKSNEKIMEIFQEITRSKNIEVNEILKDTDHMLVTKDGNIINNFDEMPFSGCYQGSDGYGLVIGGYNVAKEMLFKVIKPILISGKKDKKHKNLLPSVDNIEDIEYAFQRLEVLLNNQQSKNVILEFRISKELKIALENVSTGYLNQQTISPVIEENIREWINIIDSLYESVNSTPRMGFEAENKFWHSLHEKLLSASDFANSETMLQTLQILKMTNNYVLYSTLQNTFEFSRLITLCEVFMRFYSQIPNIQNTEEDFLNTAFIIVKLFSGPIPRIIHKSLCIHFRWFFDIINRHLIKNFENNKLQWNARKYKQLLQEFYRNIKTTINILKDDSLIDSLLLKDIQELEERLIPIIEIENFYDDVSFGIEPEKCFYENAIKNFLKKKEYEKSEYEDYKKHIIEELTYQFHNELEMIKPQNSIINLHSLNNFPILFKESLTRYKIPLVEYVNLFTKYNTIKKYEQFYNETLKTRMLILEWIDNITSLPDIPGNILNEIERLGKLIFNDKSMIDKIIENTNNNINNTNNGINNTNNNIGDNMDYMDIEALIVKNAPFTLYVTPIFHAFPLYYSLMQSVDTFNFICLKLPTNLFKMELEEVFSLLQKIVYLRWRTLIKSDLIQSLSKSMIKLERTAYSFLLTYYRITREDYNFTWDINSYAGDKRAIEYAVPELMKKHLKARNVYYISMIDNLFRTVPPLECIFSILEEIIPQGMEIKRKEIANAIEWVIEMVSSEYFGIKKEFFELNLSFRGLSLIEKYKLINRKIEIYKKMVNNEYNLYIFKSECDDDELMNEKRGILKEMTDKVKVKNDEIKKYYEKVTGEGVNRMIRIIEVREYLESDEIKEIKELKEILEKEKVNVNININNLNDINLNVNELNDKWNEINGKIINIINELKSNEVKLNDMKILMDEIRWFGKIYDRKIEFEELEHLYNIINFINQNSIEIKNTSVEEWSDKTTTIWEDTLLQCNNILKLEWCNNPYYFDFPLIKTFIDNIKKVHYNLTQLIMKSPDIIKLKQPFIKKEYIKLSVLDIIKEDINEIVELCNMEFKVTKIIAAIEKEIKRIQERPLEKHSLEILKIRMNSLKLYNRRNCCKEKIIKIENIINEMFAVYENIKRIEYLLNNINDRKYINDKLKSLSRTIKDKYKIEALLKEAEIMEREYTLYLEKCREAVPRLYLLDNDDLISVVKDIRCIKGVISKLFNFNELIFDDNNKVIGFSCKEEFVMLSHCVELNDYKDINNLEEEIKNTQERMLRENKLTCQLKDNITCNNAIIEKYTTKYGNEILKFYPKIKILEDSIIVDDVLSEKYGFEYYPPSDFVFTKQTFSLFSAMTLYLASARGTILYGCSGSGKTEVVRYYSRARGKLLVTFCCGDEWNVDTLRRIIHFCRLKGAWICFDEFNRLEDRVMSSITEEILQIPKDGNTKIFLTMNLGYAGRFELPRSLRDVLGCLRVEPACLHEILSVYTAEADKIYGFLESFKKKITDLVYYDFGLRAINAMFKNLTVNNIVDALCLFYYPILQEKHKQIFNEEIIRAFNVVPRSFSIQELFEHALKIKNGIILLGDNVSDIIKNEEGVIVHYYNPMMPGIFDSNSPFICEIKKRENKHIWFVFDGPLRSRWIENFNSILDDNRLLCLSSGERIPVHEKYKFIFISKDLGDITPATLTRVQLIINHSNINLLDKKSKNFTYDVNDTIDDYSYNLAKLIKHERVIILKGPVGSGKTTLIKGVITAHKYSYKHINFKFYKKSLNDLQTNETFILLIEEFNYATLELYEQIREYNNRGTIYGEVIDNLIIIGIIDDDNLNDRNDNAYGKIENIHNEFFILNIKEPNNMDQIIKDLIKKYLPKNEDLFDIFIKLKEKTTLRVIKRIIKEISNKKGVIKDVLFKEAILYFKPEEYSTIGNIIYKKDVDINFNVLDLLFCKKNVSIIIKGKRLSGKSLLLSGYKNFKIINEKEITNEMKYNVFNKHSNDGRIYLVRDEILLPKHIINSSYLIEHKFKLCNISSCDLIISECDDGYLINNSLKLSNPYKLLAFINTYKSLTEELKFKRKEREEYIKQSIEKIGKYQRELFEYEESISLKNKELDELNREEKINLAKILSDKTKIIERKKEVEELRGTLEQSICANKERKAKVEQKKGEVWPLVEEAMEGLRGLTKIQLSEIKSLSSPPEIVKKIIESVCTLVEGEVIKGSTVKKMLKGDLMKRVWELQYYGDGIPSPLNVSYIDKSFFLDEENYNNALKASQASAPLFRWINANIKYSLVHKEIEPLEKETNFLMQQITNEKNKILEKEKELHELECKLKDAKLNYKRIVKSVTENSKIREELEVKRNILKNIVVALGNEKKRWRNWVDVTEGYRQCVRVWSNKGIGRDIMMLIKNRIPLFIIDPWDEFFNESYVNEFEIISLKGMCDEVRNNTIIKDCDIYDVNIYKLLKKQIHSKEFMIILHSNMETNYYKEETITLYYEEDIIGKKEDELEERLLRLINSNLTNEDSLKIMLDVIEELNKKREANFIKESNCISFYKIRDELENRFGIRVSKKMFDISGFTSVNEFYCGFKPRNHTFILSEINRWCKIDYTICITDFDISYKLQNELRFDEVISCGSEASNNKVRNLLLYGNGFYLIKNIHFIEDLKKQSNGRFIYTIEWKGKNHALMSGTRIMFYEACVETELIEEYGKSFMVDLHLGMLKLGRFGVNDLEFLISNSNLWEFIVEIVYLNRLDDKETGKELVKKINVNKV